MKLAGVELYFDDLERARSFYSGVLGLRVTESKTGHHIKLAVGDSFLCCEAKGVESYPSAHKAVIFLEVPDLRDVLQRIDSSLVLQRDFDAAQPWAVVRDPEAHNVLFLQSSQGHR